MTPDSASSFMAFLYVAGTVLVALYLYSVFLPYIRKVIISDVDPEERAAELLREYKRRPAASEAGSEVPPADSEEKPDAAPPADRPD